MKLSRKFTHAMNEVFAGTLEEMGRRIMVANGPESAHEASVLRVAARIVRKHRDLNRKETS